MEVLFVVKRMAAKKLSGTAHIGPAKNRVSCATSISLLLRKALFAAAAAHQAEYAEAQQGYR